LNKISGPLLDRIDLHVEVTPVSFKELAYEQAGEDSSSIRERVIRARLVQQARYQHSETHCNAQMSRAELLQHCAISDAGRDLLKNAMDRLGLSARAYDRILKVARTVADLDGHEIIDLQHLSEAIQLRSLDRENWAG
jgi:magnesium chelatase family protein